MTVNYDVSTSARFEPVSVVEVNCPPSAVFGVLELADGVVTSLIIDCFSGLAIVISRSGELSSRPRRASYDAGCHPLARVPCLNNLVRNILPIHLHAGTIR